MWARLGALFLTAVAVPLLVPNVYIPIDPKVRFSLISYAAAEDRLTLHFPSAPSLFHTQSKLHLYYLSTPIVT